MALIVHSITVAAVAGAITLSAALTVQAQLLSPGELSASHAELEGVANCTSCHTIGGKGVDQAKCLNCHELIRSRIEIGRGYHGALKDPCVVCHKDHLGRDFTLVRFDTASFDHSRTGYGLSGAHARAQCSSCHRDALVAEEDVVKAIADRGSGRRTYLGLQTSCTSCHARDNPHEEQFSEQACSDCHGPEKWAPAVAFRHDETAFALTGRHADVGCLKCHPAKTAEGGKAAIQFVGLRFRECSDCHRDPHVSSFGAACSTCHKTDDWSDLVSARSFSHDRTGYRLLGAHRRLSCAGCHGRPPRDDASIHITFAEARTTRTFPKIEASTCLSCHRDYHSESFRDELAGISCDACHANDAWLPTTYGIDRHNQESRFLLTGAHLSVPCGSCHSRANEKSTFLFADLGCIACHAADNPHGSQFDSRMAEGSCASCHSTGAWNSDVDFDHKSTGFELAGAHAYLTCTRCHVPQGEISTTYGIIYTGLSAACVSCHAADDPHRGQFEGRDCGACHEATTFTPVSRRFDHDETRFRLDGAHSKIHCSACHDKAVAPDGARFTRYLLEKTQCMDCHSSE